MSVDEGVEWERQFLKSNIFRTMLQNFWSKMIKRPTLECMGHTTSLFSVRFTINLKKLKVEWQSIMDSRSINMVLFHKLVNYQCGRLFWCFPPGFKKGMVKIKKKKNTFYACMSIKRALYAWSLLKRAFLKIHFNKRYDFFNGILVSINY